MTVRVLPSLRTLAAMALLAGPARSAGPSYGFVVDVTLSPRAAALLKARHEAIDVAAYYEGDPIPSQRARAGEEGRISLGYETVTIPGVPGRAVLTGNGVDRAGIGWVKELLVLVNVFSARHSSPDNMLDCGIFTGPVVKAQAGPVAIDCVLIGEVHQAL